MFFTFLSDLNGVGLFRVYKLFFGGNVLHLLLFLAVVLTVIPIAGTFLLKYQVSQFITYASAKNPFESLMIHS